MCIYIYNLKNNHVAFATIVNPDQPAHPRSLICPLLTNCSSYTLMEYILLDIETCVANDVYQDYNIYHTRYTNTQNADWCRKRGYCGK